MSEQRRSSTTTILTDEDRRWLTEWDREALSLSKPVALLESQAIYWRRDWDALAIGVVIGVLVTLAVQGAW